MEAPSPNIAQLRQTLLACLLQRVPSLGVSILGWAGAVPPILDHDSDFLHSSAQLQLSPARGGEGRSSDADSIRTLLLRRSQCSVPLSSCYHISCKFLLHFK